MAVTNKVLLLPFILNCILQQNITMCILFTLKQFRLQQPTRQKQVHGICTELQTTLMTIRRNCFQMQNICQCRIIVDLHSHDTQIHIFVLKLKFYHKYLRSKCHKCERKRPHITLNWQRILCNCYGYAQRLRIISTDSMSSFWAQTTLGLINDIQRINDQ